jgi:hypothetical protein
MAARQASVASELFGDDITKLWPISYEGQSDTACFDNALEFLVQGGYSLAHAMMMLIPEAWAGNPLMDEERRSFYEYHAALMEPWDGECSFDFSENSLNHQSQPPPPPPPLPPCFFASLCIIDWMAKAILRARLLALVVVLRSKISPSP